MDDLKRGVIKIKPVLLGIPHYRYVYGSVCSADVVGTPPITPPGEKELKKMAESLEKGIKKEVKVDFVEVEKTFIIKKLSDLRKLYQELNYDTDAIFIRTIGSLPLELYTISKIGIPVINRIDNDFLRGLRVKKFLKRSKFLYIGEIPSFSAPDGPWDFFMLEDRFGVRVRHIETNEFFRVFDSFSDKEVEKELNKWKKDFRKIIEPDKKELMNETRVYLALKHLCEIEDANGLTVNCGRFTEERPVVPCLAFARLIDEGIMCSCEGDITAMISSLMIHAISGQSFLMGNFGSKEGEFEAKKGEVTIEHDIIPLSMAKNKFVVRDYHGRKFGVTGYADIKKEKMTILNLDKSLNKISVIEGEIKNSEDGIHCRVIVHMKVNGDVKKVPEIMVGSQHVSMTFGHWLKPLKKAAQLLNLEVSSL